MKEKQMLKGNIFDIRRFSTHDGAGIRTTLFFKGCPLSCVWCHNPEGISTKSRVIYFKNKCIKCGICCDISMNNGVIINDGNIVLDITKSENWDRIINECPTKSIVYDCRQMTVEEAVNEVLRDEPFFKYGGGVTLSGGEPLLQNEFTLEFLKELKLKNVNTAIETSASVSQDILKSVLPYLDIIYCDMKIFDDDEHINYTGKSNEIIKKNIEFLLTSDKKDDVIIRTPIIPSITDSYENISNISKYISSIYKDVRYELLNYNPLAEAKYHLIDKKYYFEKNPSKYSDLEMNNFIKIAMENGIKNIILES